MELGQRLEKDVGAPHSEYASSGEARQSPDAVENVPKRRKAFEQDDRADAGMVPGASREDDRAATAPESSTTDIKPGSEE